VGPNLDNVSLSASDIESIVRSGCSAMPSFDGRLSDAEISAGGGDRGGVALTRPHERAGRSGTG
jgi:hypothetical protein